MTKKAKSKKHEDALLQIKKAQQTVSDLCHGRRKWFMSIPLQADDPDIVISEALRECWRLIGTQALRDRIARRVIQ